MCGLYGFVGTHPNRYEILRSLCIVNSERGEHSAGLATIYKNSIKVFKKAVHPIKFANSSEFAKYTKNGMCHIGHTRFATHGDKTDENAHPFHIGRTVGAHNGTVQNLPELRTFTKQDYPVDSQFLIHLLDHHNTLEPARGSLTVTYHQIGAEPILNMMRFGNTLHFVCDSSSQWIAYSSSLQHLVLALAMANTEFSREYELKDGEHVQVYQKDGKIKLHTRNTGYKASYAYSGNNYGCASHTTHTNPNRSTGGSSNANFGQGVNAHSSKEFDVHC